MAQHPSAQEFTPEINQAFLSRLTGQASRRGATARGRKRREAIERGLEGDPFEASAVGGVEQGTRDLISDLETDFAFRGAGLQREERLIGEGRGFQTSERLGRQEFSAGESEKDRILRRFLQREKIDAQGNPLTNALIGAGGRIAGGFLGGLRSGG